jgi:uncharacterized protein (DUF427 family)
MTASPEPSGAVPASSHAHAITVTEVPGTVHILVDGVSVARSTSASVLREGSLPPRYYLPREHVRTDLLVPSESSTTCPFKGAASYWTLVIDGQRHEDIVWSYETPIPEMAGIAGRLSFYNERVDLVIEPTGGITGS